MSTLKDKLKDLLWSFKKNKKAQIVTAVAIVLVLVLVLLYFILRFFAQDDSVKNDANNSGSLNKNGNTVEVSETTPRRLDGVAVEAAISNLPVVAIVIENLVSIRPQSSLGQANLVYETLAEGGITRFLALYSAGQDIDRIGPVRSARLYFVDWAEEYSGLFAHVGGSPQALGALGTEEYLTDLNQFGYSQFYFRDDNIGAPHNLFTTSELMTFALRDLDLQNSAPDYDPFLFKKDTDKKNRPETVDPIGIEFSSADYAVEWRYDRDSNSYLRWNGGIEHMDANTNEQIRAKNIVVQYVDSSLIDTESGRLDITTLGEGNAIVFQDGEAITGTWKKTERGDRTKFYDEGGDEIKMNAGTTWIEAVPNTKEVSY